MSVWLLVIGVWVILALAVLGAIVLASIVVAAVRDRLDHTTRRRTDRALGPDAGEPNAHSAGAR